MTEEISQLTPAEINILIERKNKALVNLIMLSLGSAFAVILFYITYKERPTMEAFWILLTVSLAVLGFYGFLMLKFAGQMSRIGREIKNGVKKTIVVRLEDYSENDYYNDDGNYVRSDYYFHAGGQKYEVLKDQYYNFLNGDLVKISYSPLLNIAFHIEKIEKIESEKQIPEKN